MKLSDGIKNKVEQAAGEIIFSVYPVGGGSISEAFKLETKSGRNLFLKINTSSPPDMFLKEANGLKELKIAGAIKIPEVIVFNSSFILIDFISSSPRSKNLFEDFGIKFAKLHKYFGKNFGFYEDNYIGSTPQKNIAGADEKNDWIKFYFNKRILYQYQLAEKNGFATAELTKGIFKIGNKAGQILSGVNEKPSLLHGDLWSGNFIVDEKGEACLIDPAVYYGNREADLAMTKLFGGFSPAFYSAYNEFFPLQAGYEYRENIYKLYHVLNHLNLFGGDYYSQAMSLINFYIK
ncbi:MAG: fructosamine kinase family protein [Ignavibacteriaceae bacterium]